MFEMGSGGLDNIWGEGLVYFFFLLLLLNKCSRGFRRVWG